jgi:organic hydroperoxide reductase OsmC/OhrA
VVATKAKSFDYGVSLDETWDAWSDRGGGVLPGAEEASWTPEHLLLVGLARCSLTSLRYHCVRAGITLTAKAEAHGTVTRREEDGRFAFVVITVEGDVAFEPKPDDATVAELLAKAERDCFVGASLTVKPAYTWRVA